MDTTILFAAACAGAKCPPHAIAALAATFLVGLAAGWGLARLGGKKGKTPAKKCGNKNCACKAKPPRAAGEPRPETRAPIPAGSVEIYVGNLSYDLTEEMLRKEFEAFGKVDTARVVVNRYNNRSKGFGFVVMPNRPEAEKAIAAMSEKEVMGRKMRVNEAQNTVVQEA